MEKLATAGRIFFAIAFCGLGAEHFLLKDFVTGRAPSCIQAGDICLMWTYASGAFFMLTGLAAITKFNARRMLVGTAALIFLWSFLRHIPILFDTDFLSADWTRAGKALMLSGGILAVATVVPKASGNVSLLNFLNKDNTFIIAGRVCLGIFLCITGIQHFMYVQFVASLIPAWFPGNAVFWTYFTAIALIAGGIGLFIPYTASLAGLLAGIMVFTWFWVIHIPRVFVSVSDNIAVFEALGVSGIAFVLASNDS